MGRGARSCSWAASSRFYSMDVVLNKELGETYSFFDKTTSSIWTRLSRGLGHRLRG